MGGILKNKDETTPRSSSISNSSTKEFREQVLKNTKLNAMLKDFKPEFFNERGEVDMEKLDHMSEEDKERLKWNTKNLSENEEIQQKIMENMETTIDEPKTPFQHAVELNEYYQPDEEDELEGFSLGDPEFKVDELDEKVGASVVTKDNEPVEPPQEDEQEEEEEEAPKKKMSFAEMRKMHYHNEVPKFHPVDDDEDDE